MRKLPSPGHVAERVEGVRIFLDDVERIVQELVLGGFDVILRDDTYQYESLDEVTERRGPRPKTLTIEGKATEPELRYLTVAFEKGFARISGKPDPAFFTVRDFLRTCVPWHYAWFSPWLWYMVAVPPLFGVISYADRSSSAGQSAPMWLLILQAFALLLWGLSVLHRRLNFGLRLHRRSAAGFWSRNSDSIALLFFGSLVGSAVTALFSFLSSRGSVP